jgi:hypothetical protein
MGSLRDSGKSRYICEVLREINDLVQGDNVKEEKIRNLVAEAFDMSKRIINKLLEYNKITSIFGKKANEAKRL